MKDNLDEFISCNTEVRAVITVNKIVRRARQQNQDNGQIGNTEELLVENIEEQEREEQDIIQIEDEDQLDGDDVNELQVPEMQRNNHTWGITDLPSRRRGRVNITHCCCNECYNESYAREFNNEFECRKRGGIIIMWTHSCYLLGQWNS